MNLDILLYIVMSIGVIALISFTLYIRHKRKNTLTTIDDGVNEFEVLDKLIDDLEKINR